MLWGGNFALRRQFCSGENNFLWGGNFALGSESCSEEAMLLWGSKCCSG
ncbi:MAG TPA: hypothetical protein P5543_02020 [Planctomycetota bacterium]|nr:hypothetical protein [Planctomycetota bacterium]HRU50954.1 hypothetical protein [Planctomycetota bacterium]